MGVYPQRSDEEANQEFWRVIDTSYTHAEMIALGQIRGPRCSKCGNTAPYHTQKCPRLYIQSPPYDQEGDFDWPEAPDVTA